MIRFVLAMWLLAKLALAETLILASTNSVENSGLLPRILPELTVGLGIEAREIALRTWLAFGNRRDLIELVVGDPALINRYNVIELNPQTHPAAKAQPAHRLAAWLMSHAGQAAIGRYMIGGEQLFHPSAR